MTDTIARRPRLALDALYFKDSYKAEIECIDQNIELLDIIIQNQISLEKAENSHVHESLNLSYTLANKKAKEDWKYNDADTQLHDLIQNYYDDENTNFLKR